MVKITGADKVRAKLKNLASPEVAAQVTKALYVAGQQIEIEAERLITEGSVSGKMHVPSLPGQPPNADTRELDSNIETKIISNSTPTVHVEASAPHAIHLELGTSRMEARPFMKPAVNAKKDEALRIVVDALAQIVRKA